MEYCMPVDVEHRLTANGYKFVADRNRDRQAGAGEVDAYILSGIQYAGQLIDEALHAFVAPASARASGNIWLRDRAVDITVWYATSHGGRKPPEPFVNACEDAKQRLAAVKAGDRIPNLVYPPPPFSHGRSARFPRIVNPK